MELRSLEERIRDAIDEKDPAWRNLEGQRSEKQRGLEPVLEEYWEWIPDICLSRCPHCGENLLRKFDPLDLRGFWWMERTQRPVYEPKSCPHFRLLLGALNLNDLKPQGGIFPARPGPDKPYVIERILSMPTMTAVVSSVDMLCGYTAYPIAYFSTEKPAGGTMTQTWAGKEYRFTTDDGRKGWDQKAEEWDFDLFPWITRGKLRWIKDNTLNAADAGPSQCPYLNLNGQGKPQYLLEDKLSYTIL